MFVENKNKNNKKMKEIKGDLIKMFRNGEFDIIAHGCNCFHTMGSGIAGQLVRIYPQVLESDKRNSEYGDQSKMGTITHYSPEKDKFIVNCYSQFEFGTHKMQVEYGAIRSCLKEIKDLINKHFVDVKNVKIGLPLIGCGLAGGNWEVVKKIIESEMSVYDITIVYYGG